jgi:hypothetical protein
VFQCQLPTESCIAIATRSHQVKESKMRLLDKQKTAACIASADSLFLLPNLVCQICREIVRVSHMNFRLFLHSKVSGRFWSQCSKEG